MDSEIKSDPIIENPPLSNMNSVQTDKSAQGNIPITPNKNKKYIILSLLLFSFCLIMSLVFYVFWQSINRINKGKTIPNVGNNLVTPTPIINTDQIDKSSNNNLKTYINCLDVRGVIEKDGIDYVACLGGVLILNSKTGEIIDELNFTDGLTSNTTTSLVLHENKLYIGTQSGINIYDLNSKTIQSITTSKGLPSDQNIELFYDPPLIWVATFKGFVSLDPETSKITSYNSELKIDNTYNGVQHVLATPNSVYFYFTANAYSTGNVVRYDKKTKSWKSWGPTAFGLKDRIDIISLGYANDSVYAFAYGKYWVSDDSENAEWRESTDIFNQISDIDSSDCSVRPLGSVDGKIFLNKCEDLFVFDSSLNSTKRLLQNLPRSQNIPIIGSGYLWVFSIDRSRPWLNKYSIETGKAQSFNSKRPMEFYKILSVINDSVAFIYTSDGIDKLELATPSTDFKNVSTLIPSDSSVGFIPVAGSSKTIIYFQTCGMGCSEPEFYLYDYETTNFQNIPILESIKKIFPYEMWTASVSYDGNNESGFLVFSTPPETGLVFAYDVTNGKWITDNIGHVTKIEKNECGFTANYSVKSGFTQVKCGDKEPPSLKTSSSIGIKNGYIGTINWGGLFILKTESY